MIRMKHARTMFRTTLLCSRPGDGLRRLVPAQQPGAGAPLPGQAAVTDGVKTDWWDQAKTKKKLEGDPRREDGGDWHWWFENGEPRSPRPSRGLID
jgi:hypothetical protein